MAENPEGQRKSSFKVFSLFNFLMRAPYLGGRATDRPVGISIGMIGLSVEEERH